MRHFCDTCEARGATVTSLLMVRERLMALFEDAFRHDGFASIEVDMRILKRGQKEVILRAGKEYRFVVDYQGPQRLETNNKQGRSL